MDKKISFLSCFSFNGKQSLRFKFLAILSVFFAYFVFISFKYGWKDGFSVSILTWSFFVLCTPIADAGGLLDFPIRLITNIRMVYTEVAVWIVAISINLYSFNFNPSNYEKTTILKIFKEILTNPWPFYLIIAISAAGTFLSVYFGDELVDAVKKRGGKKLGRYRWHYEFILVPVMVAAVVILYYYLLARLKISIHF